MLGRAHDTPKRKRNQVTEPTSAMRRRLAEHGDWTQEQCDSMTKKQLNEHLGELGLKRGQTLTLRMEDYSPDLSWEECLEIKAAEEKAAAAAASACDAPQPKRKSVAEPTSAMKRRLCCWSLVVRHTTTMTLGPSQPVPTVQPLFSLSPPLHSQPGCVC